MTPTELAIAARAVHFIAVIALCGEFVFFAAIAMPALRKTGEASGELHALHARMVQFGLWSLVAALVSGAVWLAAQGATMSGQPLSALPGSGTLGAVLAKTTFGHVSQIRLGMALVLLGSLSVARRRSSGSSRIWSVALGTALSAALLGSLAWTGHANAEAGSDRVAHLLADAAHLLAAGAWLGALAPLFRALGRAHYHLMPMAAAARITRRFSVLGMASVATLLASGVANASYTVGSVPPLFGTAYGRLLLVKLALFAGMVAFAAANRLRWTPALAAPDSSARALQRLRRNALAETALGIGAVAIVGALGAMVPALHAQTLWPFSRTLGWEQTEESPGVHAIVLALWGAGLLAGLVGLVGHVVRQRSLMWSGYGAMAVAAALSAWMLAVPAYPTSYTRSPVRYTATSIALGIPIFRRHCVACHGPRGHGDGPAAAALSVKPANLAEEHLFHHGEGNLFWWVRHGIAGTPMPGFGAQMSETDTWHLLNFLRAQAESEDAMMLTASVEPWRPIVAPDFAFQVERRAQQTLKAQRGHSAVLLVLYTPPDSLPRLRQLSASLAVLGRAGVAVIAVPADAAPVLHEGDAKDIAPAMFVDADPRIVAAYRLFSRSALPARAASAPGAPPHTEFLIDRQGYLRARWTLGARPGWNRMADLLHQIDLLDHEKPHPPAPEGHVH